MYGYHATAKNTKHIVMIVKLLMTLISSSFLIPGLSLDEDAPKIIQTIYMRKRYTMWVGFAGAATVGVFVPGAAPRATVGAAAGT